MKPNTAATTLAIMYWEACRSIAQAQITRDVAGRGSRFLLTSARLAGVFRDRVHERLRPEIPVERQGTVGQMVRAGEHLVDPAILIRDSPGEDRAQRRLRRD